MLFFLLLSLLNPLVTGHPFEAQGFNANWYDAGFYGAWVGHSYESFDLQSPRVNFLVHKSCDPAYTFLSPRGRSVPFPGPLLLDAEGELVWTEDRWGQAMDMKVQNYKGEDYITFWRGSDSGTHGSGTYLMLNSSYDVVHEIQAGNAMEGDLHEFRVKGNTALITVYDVIPADLSAIGGAVDGWIYDGLIQEIDLATGDLLFQWRASDHYRIEETYAPLWGRGSSEADAIDYFHINAVDKDDLGNYYISSRYMHTITCIDPKGDLLWKLGGKKNYFEDLSQGAASNFSWQHHVTWHQGDILTLFDNGAYDDRIATAEHSRGLKVALDVTSMTVTLLQEYHQPSGVLAHSQGSIEILPSGNVFVDWGHTAGYTEYTEDGEVLCDAHFGSGAFATWGWVKSYRGFKGEWTGLPRTPPGIAMKTGWGKREIYASWNGATEVRHWRLEQAQAADAKDDQFVEIVTKKKTGFETMVEAIGSKKGFIRMVALDADSKVLGVSDVLDLETGQVPLEFDDPLDDMDVIPVELLMATCFVLSAAIGTWKLVTTFRPRRRWTAL